MHIASVGYDGRNFSSYLGEIVVFGGQLMAAQLFGLMGYGWNQWLIFCSRNWAYLNEPP